MAVLSLVVSLAAALLFESAVSIDTVPLWKRTHPGWKGNSLAPGEYLKRNEFLLSNNCMFSAWHQNDGNFVVYKNVVGFGRALWALPAGTNNKVTGTNPRVTLQADGNLVLGHYSNHKWRAVWTSKTNGKWPEALVMQNDGNLSLRAQKTHIGASWSTGTQQKGDQPNACFICSNVEITNLKLKDPIRRPGDIQIDEEFRNNCGNDKAIEVLYIFEREKRERVTKEYSFTKSFESTFSNTLDTSVSVKMTAGAKIEGLLDVSTEITASVSNSMSWSKKRSSSSTKSTAVETQEFSSKTISSPIFIPANKQVTYSVVEEWGVADVEWTATGTCRDDQGRVIERQPMAGVYRNSAYRNVRYDCDMCDHFYSSEDTGCRNKPKDSSPTPEPTGAPINPNPFYVDWNANTCKNDGNQPDWEQQLFGTQQECCDTHFTWDTGNKKCMESAVVSTPAPTPQAVVTLTSVGRPFRFERQVVDVGSTLAAMPSRDVVSGDADGEAFDLPPPEKATSTGPDGIVLTSGHPRVGEPAVLHLSDEEMAEAAKDTSDNTGVYYAYDEDTGEQYEVAPPSRSVAEASFSTAVETAMPYALPAIAVLVAAAAIATFLVASRAGWTKMDDDETSFPPLINVA